MDPRIEKLRAAGFSDADITEYLKESPPTTAGVGAAPAVEQEPPSVSPVVPETQANNVVPGTSMMEGVATAAAGITPSADTLTKIGEGALAYKGLQGWRASVEAQKARAAADAAAEAGRQARFNAKFPPAAPMTAAEQTFNTLKTPASVLNAPAAQAAQTAQAMANPSSQNFMQRASALAARYAPVAGKVATGAGILGAGLGLAHGLFGTSDEEIATLKAAEERKRQAQMMQQPR